MRNISAQAITDTVARLCIEANTRLPQDVQAALDRPGRKSPGRWQRIPWTCCGPT